MDPKIERLQRQGVYVGTSSWKYEGWKGLVYREEYPSEKAFKDNSLAEYARTYTTVGVDHTYYTWPTESGFTRYCEQVPPTFRFGLKVTEKTTVWKYPNIKRYGKEAGKLNDTFLHPDVFSEKFMRPLEKFQAYLGPIMLEFSKFYPGMIASGGEFTERLEKFLAEVRPRHPGVLFAVEMRNSSWLKPAYFEMLVRQQTAHVFNSWTQMPPVAEQLALTEDLKFPALVSRLLLRPGCTYEAAVEAFSPYDRIQDEQPETRAAAAGLIQRSLRMGMPAYVFVNNRCEGSAPKTIQGILDLIN